MAAAQSCNSFRARIGTRRIKIAGAKKIPKVKQPNKLEFPVLKLFHLKENSATDEIKVYKFHCNVKCV